MGLGITLKVMAGDKVDIYGKSYWKTADGNVPGSAATIPLLDLLTNFIGAGISGKTGVTGEMLSIAPGVMSLIDTLFKTKDQTTTQPKAYINWILFDENFRPVKNSTNSGFDAVGGNGVLKSHVKNTGEIIKNGYLYIYCSNESKLDVFFDNLQVVHRRGALISESHYGAWGNVLKGISSDASLKLPNKYKFNGIEQNNDFDLITYDAFYRNLDPQVGRWWQLDPKPNEFLSPYSAMANNPISLSDPLGDTTWLFDSKGQYFGRTDDGLENQAHFVNIKISRNAKPINFQSLSVKDQTKYANFFRSNSMAFIGSNTITEMKEISKNAGKLDDGQGGELGFVGVISDTKEIRLTQLSEKYAKENNKYDLIGAIDGTYKSPELQSNIFIVGHVHPASLNSGTSAYDGFKGVMARFLELNRPSEYEGYGNRSLPDYQPFLYRGNEKGQSPALLISAYGFTIYGTGTHYNLEHVPMNEVLPNRYNSYLLYKQIKK